MKLHVLLIYSISHVNVFLVLVPIFKAYVTNVLKEYGCELSLYSAACMCRFSSDGPQLTVDMILEVTQLCCFPFAVDIADEILQEVQQ